MKSRIALGVLAVLGIPALYATVAQAGDSGKPTPLTSFRLSPDGSAVVRIVAPETVTADTFNSNLLTGVLSGYSSTAGGALGTLSVTSFGAGFSGVVGGAQIEALYNRGSQLASGQSLEWVQVITTNLPLGGATPPYLDNAGKPNEPYYTYTAQNRSPFLPENQLNFYDFSKRDPANLATTDPINWNANLYPVIKESSTAFTVVDGISWGWTMNKAMVGSTSATFVNPIPSTAVVSGVGTDSFSWGVGEPDQSTLTFTGTTFDATPNTPFKLGTLTFHNGNIAADSEATHIDFSLGISFPNVPEKAFNFTTPFTLINTLNTGDPIASADTVGIGNFGFTFNVLEGATASVDLFGILSTGLTATPSGAETGAELSSVAKIETNPDPVYSLTISGITDPTAGGFVPEPAPFTTILPILLWLLYRHRRNTRQV